jgi:hypothetical protein
LDLHPLHQPHIVLIFELLLEVLLDASIVDARNKVAITITDISDQVLHLVLKQVSDLIRDPRVGAPNRLDGHPQLVSVEVNLRLTRIYSDVLEQHLVEVILVVFEVPEQVVPLFIVHILGTFIFIIASEVDVDAISLGLLILILQAAIFMQEKLQVIAPSFSIRFSVLRISDAGWEDSKSHFVIMVKEVLNVVSHPLELQFVLPQALDDDILLQLVRIGLGALGSHLDVKFDSSVSNLLKPSLVLR